MIDEAIRARVESLPDVSALVGDRVFLDRLPQSASYPAVRVTLVDEDAAYHQRGPVGLERARVQVDAYAQDGSGVDTKRVLSQLADAIHGDGIGADATGLSGFVGPVGSPAVDIRGCFRVLKLGPRFDADELNVLTLTQDYYVWFRP